MITSFILSFFLSSLTYITSWLPSVTSLPFNMDTAITTFVGDINGLIIVMPWMKIVWQLALFALLIKALFLALHFGVFLLNIIRGSGTKAPTSARG